MSQPKRDPPLFWIIGGPNGSGKSSVYENTIFQDSGQSIWIINPDKLSARIDELEHPSDANLEAVIRIENWLEASIRAYQNIGVETVLSTAKYKRLVTLAHALGFRFQLTYVLLESPEHCVERVKLRVEKGGHKVPENKIKERYGRSLEQLPWFLEAADVATIFDNSGSAPRLIAEKHEGVLTLDDNVLPSIRNVAHLIES